MDKRIARFLAVAVIAAAMALGLLASTASASTASASTGTPAVAARQVATNATLTSHVTTSPGPTAAKASTPATGKVISRSVNPAFFVGFCITAWSGRYVTTSCNGVGAWRQYAYCSGSGFRWTSPWLPDPPVDFWIAACPAGSHVTSAGVAF
jgi:hypothetical protein